MMVDTVSEQQLRLGESSDEADELCFCGVGEEGHGDSP
jgi:hypothetical protein